MPVEQEDRPRQDEAGRSGTYKTLEEQTGKLSPAEERFERRRRTVGLFAGPLVLAAMLLIPFGGLLLPIGSPPNLIGRELLEDATGEPITFFEWFLTALPIVIVMFAVVILIVAAFNRPEVKHVDGVDDYVAEERRKLGALTRGEKNTLQVGEAANEGIVAILAAAMLFVLPVDWARRRFTLNWNQAATSTGGP